MTTLPAPTAVGAYDAASPATPRPTNAATSSGVVSGRTTAASVNVVPPGRSSEGRFGRRRELLLGGVGRHRRHRPEPPPPPPTIIFARATTTATTSPMPVATPPVAIRPSHDVLSRFDRCGRGPHGDAAADKGGVVVGDGDMWRAT